MLRSGMIVIDDGGNSTCVITKDGQELFPSVKGLYGNRNLTETNGKYDYVVDYKGKRYVMGTIAKLDCRLPLQMHTKSKQNIFFDLSILVAIHKFGYESNFVVTSVPITMHNDDEKIGRTNRLIGDHTITVNGVEKSFNIVDVKVAPETAVAFWISEPHGKTRFLDLGSRTVGYATTVNKDGDIRFIDTESGTLNGKGLEALGDDYDQQALADFICGRLIIDWKESDKVQLLGGGALDEKLVSSIREYFPNAIVLDNPQMSNALGMYFLGRIAYNMS